MIKTFEGQATPCSLEVTKYIPNEKERPVFDLTTIEGTFAFHKWMAKQHPEYVFKGEEVVDSFAMMRLLYAGKPRRLSAKNCDIIVPGTYADILEAQEKMV